VRWKRTLARWQVPQVDERMTAGPLSLGRLVFVPDPNGNIYAFDASNGKLEWQYHLSALREDGSFVERLHDWLSPLKRWLFRQPPVEDPSAGNAPPIAYQVEGRVYVAVVVGVTREKGPGEAVLYAFALPAANP
jgi:glucose dehydrogenase